MACDICNSKEHNRRTCPFNVDKDGKKLVRKVVKDAPITDDREKLLLDIIDEGIIGNVIDLVISATKGELNVNAVEEAAVGCCLAMLKRRNN